MGLVHRVGWDPLIFERNAWFWPLADVAAHFSANPDWPSLHELGAVYRDWTRDDATVPELRFCENVRKQDKRAQGRVVLSALYDARITLKREVPTRERNWHDLLNMLCFTTFPHSKLALHARQYARLEERIGNDSVKLPGRRTPEQDALTLFDEGGVVLAVEAAAALQLQAAPASERDALSLQLCEARRLRVVPFGHALYEHMVEGLRCPGGCTQVIVVSALWSENRSLLREVDRGLAAHLMDPANLQSPASCGQIKLSTFDL